jgi:hypothetical protein
MTISPVGRQSDVHRIQPHKESVMIGRKLFIAASLATTLGLASLASANDTQTDRVVFVGGHNPMQMFRVEPKSEPAPYALTGNDRETAQQPRRVENIWIGSRFAGVRVIGE